MGLSGLGSTLVFRKDEIRTLAIPSGLLIFLGLTRSPGWMVALAAVQLGVLLLKMGPYLPRRYAGERPASP